MLILSLLELKLLDLRRVQGLEGKSLQQLTQQLQENYAESVVSNWKLWVPCQVINLGFVPGHLQVLVSNIVALAWNSYMSYITHRPAVVDERDSP